MTALAMVLASATLRAQDGAPPVDEAPPIESPAAEDVPPVDPGAALQRFQRGVRGRAPSTDDDAPRAPSVEAPPVPAAPSTGGTVARLRLRSGAVVEGEVLAESAEGWVLRVPGGESRFFDRLDVVDAGPGRVRASWTQKAWLAASLLFPGAGQVLYGAAVQPGAPWERSAIVVGTVLASVGVLGAALAAGGAVAAMVPAWQGSALIAGGVLNPVSLAGVVVVGLAGAVGLLDAGARVLID